MPDRPEQRARFLVVLPAFQEESSIASTLREVAASVPEYDLLVVDDGSRDHTAQEARSCGVDVVSAPFNMGVGAAMRIGFLYALRHGYDVVVQVDADGQHDPTGIRRLVGALQHADVVVGSRFTGQDEGTPSSRRWMMWVLARIVSMLCRSRMTDVTSGFRAAGPRAIAILAHHYPAEYLGDTIESLVIAHRAGLVIAEIPVTMRPRVGGVPSQSPLRAALYLSRSLLVLLLAAIRSHPEVRAAARMPR
jgi:glycosyltransferase involved in cell wall biosynthesis